MKSCSRCGEVKALTEFPRAETCVDGTRSYCKSCDKVRKDEWRKANLDRHSAKVRKWARANRDKRLAVQRASNHKRAESGKSAASSRAWRAQNLDRARAAVSARRRKIRQASPPWVDRAELRRVYREAVKLGLTVDHVVPIQHALVCGLHVPWNLRVVPRADNCRKSNAFNGVRTRRRPDGSMKENT